MEKKEEKKMQLDEQLMDNVNGGANYVSQQTGRLHLTHRVNIIIVPVGGIK